MKLLLWLAAIWMLGGCSTFYVRLDYDATSATTQDMQVQDIDLVWVTEDEDPKLETDEAVRDWFNKADSQRQSWLDTKLDDDDVPLAMTFKVGSNNAVYSGREIRIDWDGRQEFKIQCPSGAKQLWVLVGAYEKIEGTRLRQVMSASNLPKAFTIHVDRSGLAGIAIRRSK